LSDREQTGVVFPRGDDGARSTTGTGKQVWAAAARAVDAALAERIDGERSWRSSYVPRVVEVTAAATRSSAAAVAVARAGLAALADRMVFERHGESRPVPDAVKNGGGTLATQHVAGQGERVRELVVPYRGDHLRGEGLLRRLDDWVGSGTVERSCAEALARVVAHPQWLDLRDRSFAVLGAAAELGPVPSLLGWGAHVAAVDLPQPDLQQRLLDAARAGAGTLDLPRSTGATTGADLLAETPEIAQWLVQAADGRPLTVGSYAYADGARHVQLAMASDAVVEHLLRSRADVSYAELATPTDAYAVPADVVEEARRRWERRGWRKVAQAPVRTLSRGSLYAPSYGVTVTRDSGEQVGIADVLVPQQGPNYTLAKRLQRWRAVAAQADGAVVSANIAPATSTRSVTRNRMLAAAYAGAGTFGVEVFAPATSRVLMAALLVHDLRAEARPPGHADDLFVSQAAHGGLWRVPYAPRSVLGLAAVRGLPRVLRT
jgi:hypothetical protein